MLSARVMPKMKFRATSNTKYHATMRIYKTVGEEPFTVADIPEDCAHVIKRLLNDGYITLFSKEKRDRRNVYRISAASLYHINQRKSILGAVGSAQKATAFLRPNCLRLPQYFYTIADRV